MKKKILALGILVFLLTGCYYWPTVKGVKKYGLDDCDGLTIEESVDKYLKGATWDRKDKDTYLVKGTGKYSGNNEPIEIQFKLEDKKIEIKHYYVDGFDRLDKADTYLYPNLCPNRKAKDDGEGVNTTISCTGVINSEGVDVDTDLTMDIINGKPGTLKMIMTADTGQVVSDEMIKQTKEEVQKAISKDNSLGFTYDIEKDGVTGLKQTMTFDLGKMDWGDLESIIDFSDATADSTVDGFIAGFEAQGLTCTKGENI